MTGSGAAILILCSPDDLIAQPVLQIIRRAYDGDVVAASADDLAGAPLWRHEVGKAGEIGLEDGRLITDSDVAIVFNRLVTIDAPLGEIMKIDTREYGRAEMHALFASWLHSLGGRVVNRPSPTNLCGAQLTLAEDRLVLSQAGLPVAPMLQRTRGRIGSEEGWVRRPSTEIGQLALGGWPVTLEAPTAERRKSFFVGGRLLGDPLPDAVAEGLCDVLNRRGLGFAKVIHYLDAEGQALVGQIDSMPASADAEVISELAQFLITMARGSA